MCVWGGHFCGVYFVNDILTHYRLFNTDISFIDEIFDCRNDYIFNVPLHFSSFDFYLPILLFYFLTIIRYKFTILRGRTIYATLRIQKKLMVPSETSDDVTQLL